MEALHDAYGKNLDKGLEQFVGVWTIFLSSSTNQRTLVLNKINGGMTMFSTIQPIFYNVCMQFGHPTYKWIGIFSPLDVLIGVGAYTREEAYMTFDVNDGGRLNYTHT